MTAVRGAPFHDAPAGTSFPSALPFEQMSIDALGYDGLSCVGGLIEARRRDGTLLALLSSGIQREENNMLYGIGGTILIVVVVLFVIGRL